MKIEVSNGEIADKVTILEIKMKEITDPVKQEKVKKEYAILSKDLASFLDTSTNTFYKQLYDINYKLWHIEDEIRICELNKDSGERFIALARSVYVTNDERAHVKSLINKQTKSEIEEVKSYAPYL